MVGREGPPDDPVGVRETPSTYHFLKTHSTHPESLDSVLFPPTPDHLLPLPVVGHGSGARPVHTPVDGSVNRPHLVHSQLHTPSPSMTTTGLRLLDRN